tara:strand:- start:220 stop:780 length:561 start_codon:yes stop_codon:yes gene_type:complete
MDKNTKKNNKKNDSNKKIDNGSNSESKNSDLGNIENVIEENNTLKDTILRLKAEAENIQKRADKKIADAYLYGIEELSSSILTIRDGLEAAVKAGEADDVKVETVIQGDKLLLKTMDDIFEKLKVEEINPINEEFNPELHEAMATKESEMKDNTVLEVLQKGYRIPSKLLRPAFVIVSKKNNKENA